MTSDETFARRALCILGWHGRVDWERGAWFPGFQRGTCIDCGKTEIRRLW